MIFGENQVGLEHVRAVWGAEAQAQREREEREILQLGPLLWRNEFGKRDGNKAWRELSPGYRYAEAEAKQVELIERCISKKVTKRTEIKFQECWLVVDGAQDGVPDLDVQLVEDGLQPSLLKGRKSFDFIWIDYGSNDGIRRYGSTHGLLSGVGL